MSRQKIVNGFEIDCSGVISVIDFDAIFIGPENECRKIRLNNRDFLVVSKDFRINTPSSVVPHMDQYAIAPLPLAFHKSGSVICYRASRCKDGEDMVIDMGITFEGDEKFEFGRYFLWNPETGKLSLSEELDWLEVTKRSAHRGEKRR